MGKHERDRERTCPGAEQGLVQVRIERGELLVGRLLRQIRVRPEALQRPMLRGIGGHGIDDIVLHPSAWLRIPCCRFRDRAMPDFSVIPSIEQLRQRPAIRALEARFGAEATVGALRAAAAEARRALASGAGAEVVGSIEQAAATQLAAAFRPSLAPVINATGVVIHTNLGRAPLAAVAIERVADVARGYSSLEYDVDRGARGRRDVHAEGLICRLTGAEAAVVVNNNAAATMIVLAALAAGREVIVSRGELVEIGGGFRVPDVMAQ